MSTQKPRVKKESLEPVESLQIKSEPVESLVLVERASSSAPDKPKRKSTQHIPQYLGGPKRPAAHSGKSKACSKCAELNVAVANKEDIVVELQAALHARDQTIEDLQAAVRDRKAELAANVSELCAAREKMEEGDRVRQYLAHRVTYCETHIEWLVGLRRDRSEIPESWVLDFCRAKLARAPS